MNKDSMAFVVYMIHRCANQWGLSPAAVYRKLKESGCIDTYLVPHYGVLHTQSSAYVLNDIEQYLRIRGIAVCSSITALPKLCISQLSAAPSVRWITGKDFM